MQRVGLAACGVVLGAAAWLMLHNLQIGPPQLYDEGTYAQVTQESFNDGNIFDLRFQDKSWFEKPPVYFWLAKAATSLTGDPILGIRIPSALFGIVVVVMTMLLAYAFTKKSLVGAIAGAILILTPPFIDGAREARLDI